MERELPEWVENLKFFRIKPPVPFVSRELRLFNKDTNSISVEFKEKLPFQLAHLAKASNGKGIEMDHFSSTVVVDEYEVMPEDENISIKFEFSKFHALAVWEEKENCIVSQLRKNLSFEKYFDKDSLP